ncbi:SH3 domain-containing protein [Planktosalinus lacus]|uniref:BatE protein n=1 Tax=Planktosalinus lacus TaxID=1526573 RepID=A0A8J2V423_9FLAO|nr:SH3 domain-containing protein [Planktosalinus lacus]GGD81234.1 BatE protein [Planktosalinus lacus]
MKTLIYIVVFTLSFVAFPQNENAFEEGKSHYKEANYEAAINTWESILESGKHSAALYYNLGNAYFKSNEIAPSIYYYEKALNLAPGDSDIENNLAIAQSQTVDIIEPLPKNLISTWVENAISAFSFDTWAWMSVFLVFVFAILFLIYFFSRRSSIKRIYFSGAFIVLFFAIVSLYIAFMSYNSFTNDRSGIIFATSTQVRSEPLNRSETSFVLHEGTKVEIIDEDDDWFRVQLADGKDGWVQKGDLKEL